MSGDGPGAAETFFREWLRVWVENDLTGLRGIFTEDVIYRWNPGEEPVTGIEALVEYWDHENSLQDLIEVDCRRPRDADGMAVAEMWVRMRYRGGRLSDPSVKAVGPTEITAILCAMAELEADGRASQVRQYHFEFEGRRPTPAWWGTELRARR